MPTLTFDAYEYLGKVIYLISINMLHWEDDLCHTVLEILFNRIPHTLALDHPQECPNKYNAG